MAVIATTINRILYSRVFRNLFFWYLFTFYIVASREDHKLITFLILPCILIISFGIPCYLNNLWLIPRFFIKRNYIKYSLFFVLLLALTTIESYYVTHLVNTINPECRYLGNFRNADAVFHAFPSLFFFMALAGGKFTADAISNQRKLEMLEKQKLESELESLKLQISPHFIFNALNTIYGLSRRDNSMAAEATIKLSDILRYILSDCNGARICIKQEVDFLHQYIAFARLRTRPNARINFDIEYDEGQQQIAPLLLLPILENAIKHGLAKQIENPWIDVRLDVKANQLCFYCANSNYNKSALAMNTGSGIGLKNVMARLKLIYGKYHTFTVKETQDVYTTRLVLELV